MENQTRLPSNEAIISAYEDCYGNSRKVLEVTLVSSIPKIQKLIAEYVVVYLNQDGELKEESVIGKMYSDSNKGDASFQFLQYLWENGFGTDPQYTIVRPIAYFDEWKMMIMSKSPGQPLDDWIHDPGVNNKQLAFLIAEWLTRVHSLPLTEVRQLERTRANADLNRLYEGLTELIPSGKEQLKSIYDDFVRISDQLKSDKTVLLHGDFHTENVFIDDQKVIAIDFDHHFAGDPAWDVAYMACQIQVSSFFKKGDFDYFKPMIEYFIDTYLDTNPAYSRQAFLDRISIYSARSLFESLHYELCVLKTGNFSIVPPFLEKCELYLQGRVYK
jgi:aminoglycoside phosphotransferase